MKTFPAALAACLFGACAPSNKSTEKEEPKKTDESRIVGRIASVFPKDRRFVLIQSYGTWNVPTGTILISQGPEGRSANLLATGEKLGQYAAADLRSGTLEVGDAVIHRPALSPEETVSTAQIPEPEAKEEPQPAPAAGH